MARTCVLRGRMGRWGKAMHTRASLWGTQECVDLARGAWRICIRNNQMILVWRPECAPSRR